MSSPGLLFFFSFGVYYLFYLFFFIINIRNLFLKFEKFIATGRIFREVDRMKLFTEIDYMRPKSQFIQLTEKNKPFRLLTLFCGIQFSVLQFKLYFCSARTRECASFCIFLNQICTSQSTCLRHDALALYSPPRCYLVNLNYWLPRSGSSSFPSKQKSHIKEMNWPNLFKSLSNISLCVYAK